MSGKNKLQATPRQNLFAVLLMLALLVLLGARLWLEQEASQLLGPSLLNSNTERLLAEIGRSLYLMDRDGNLLDSVSLAELGIEGEITDLQIIDDTEVLLGDWDGQRILRCDIIQRDCQPLPLDEQARPRSFFKFHFDKANQRLFLADNGRNIILLVDSETGTSRPLSRPGQFRSPSQIGLTQDGLFYVVDTNHFRLAIFDSGGQRLDEPVMEIRAAQTLTKATPISAAPLPDGRWAVLFANIMLGDAELQLFDRDGMFQQKVVVPGAGELRSLVGFDDVVLAGDIENLRLYRIEPATASVGEFGSQQLKDRLSELRQRKQSLLRLSNTLLVLMVVLVVLAIMLAIAVSRNRSQESRHHHAQPAQQHIWHPARLFPAVVWVGTDIRTFRKMYRLLATTAAVFITLDIMLVGFYSLTGADNAMLSLLFAILILSGLFLLLSLVLFLYYQRLSNYRIGSDGKQLYLMNHKKFVLPFPPEDAVYTRQQLSYGPWTLPLYNPKNGLWFFHQQRFEDFIRPLLEQGTELNLIGMSIYRLRHGNPMEWASLIFILLALPAIVIFA